MNKLPSHSTHWAENINTGEIVPVCYVNDVMLYCAAFNDIQELPHTEWQLITLYTRLHIVGCIVALSVLALCAFLDYVSVNV